MWKGKREMRSEGAPNRNFTFIIHHSLLGSASAAKKRSSKSCDHRLRCAPRSPPFSGKPRPTSSDVGKASSSEDPSNR